MIGNTGKTLYICGRHGWHDTQPCPGCRSARSTDRQEVARLTAETERLREQKDGWIRSGQLYATEAQSEVARLQDAVRAFLAVAWAFPIGDGGRYEIDANDISALESALDVDSSTDRQEIASEPQQGGQAHGAAE